MIEVSFVFYFLTFIMIIGVALSYYIAFSIKRSLPILALLLFFIMTATLVGLTTLDQGFYLFAGERKLLPGQEYRAIIYFFITLFLFYTTWRKN